jgi:hypothetical protein
MAWKVYGCDGNHLAACAKFHQKLFVFDLIFEHLTAVGGVKLDIASLKWY